MKTTTNTKINDVNLDSFIDSFGTASLPSKGKHTVTLESYKMVPAKTADDGTIVAQAYVSLAWNDREKMEMVDARLYSAAVPYFMDGVNRQVDGAFMGMKLSAILESLKTREITITVDWSSKYGVQVSYFE